MAKRKGPNKAAAIRDYLAANPTAKGVEVVAALAKAGIKVAPAQVSNVKVLANKNRPGRKPAQQQNQANDVVAAIEAAVKLMKSAGSAENAKLVIDILNGNLVGNG